MHAVHKQADPNPKPFHTHFGNAAIGLTPGDATWHHTVAVEIVRPIIATAPCGAQPITTVVETCPTARELLTQMHPDAHSPFVYGQMLTLCYCSNF